MLGGQWWALQREAQLAAEQAARGVTVLGRANHAETGLYAQAFFDLSIALERTGKIIFLADHAIRNQGTFPSNQALRRLGHRIDRLLTECETIGGRIDPTRRWADRPTDTIHQSIVQVLDKFASSLRYYNLDLITQATGPQQDPVALWWDRVARPILDKHYTVTQREKDDAEGVALGGIAGQHFYIEYTSEEGYTIEELNALFLRARASQVVQRHGRLYTMQIIRWLAAMLRELSHHGGYDLRIEALVGLDEPYWIFLNEDGAFRNRKTWSIYRR